MNRNTKHIPQLALLCSLLATTGSLAARDSSSSTTESPAHPATEDGIVVLDPMTVVGTGIALPTIKYPGSVTVVTLDDISAKSDIIQSLSIVPGFETGNDNGRSLGQQYSIRGFGYGTEDRVIVELDGVRRSTSLYSNQVSSFRVDSALLKEIEVVKGASSIYHGGGAIGGVVGMTTKDAADFVLPGRTTGAVVNGRYETNNLREGSIGVAALQQGKIPELLVYYKQGLKSDLTLSEDLPLTGGGTYDTVDNREELSTLFLKSGWEFAPGQRLTLSFMRYHEDTEVTWQSLYHSSYSSVTGPVLGELDQQDWVARYTLKPVDNDWIDLNASAYRSEANYERGYTYTTAAGKTTDLYYDNRDRRWGLKAQNLSRFTTGPVAHRLLLGFDYQHREEDALYVLNTVVTDFGSMPNQYDDLGVYVQEEAGLLDERLLLQLGGRYDSFQREVDGKDAKYDNTRFSPRVGLSYEVARGVYLLGNFSESFRAPTPHETSSTGALNIHYHYLPNPDLGPETAKEFEFGAAFERSALLRADDRFRTKLMVFTGRIDGLIELVPDYDGPTPSDATYYATYRNVDRVDREGLEWEATYETRFWGLRASYELLDQKDAATEEKTPFAYADKIQVGVSLRPFGSDYTFSTIVEHWLPPEQNPKTYLSGGTTYTYVDDDYTIVGASFVWRPTLSGLKWFDNTAEVRLGANNLFNAPRLNASNVSTSARVGLGRNFYLSLTKRF